MRTLHVYSGNLYGGIERSLITCARSRHACPHLEMHFALCFDGQLSQELEALNIPVHRLGSVRVSRPWTVWRARRRLRQLLSEQPYDAIIAHACWAHVIAGPVARKLGLPLVAWAHDTLSGRHIMERLARLNQPDLVLANSRYTASTVTRVFPDAKIEVQHAPVPPPPAKDRQQTREEVRKRLKVPPETAVILLASRLERWKGHTLLLDALGKLRHKSNWTCWIAGGVQRPHEREYLNELQQMAKRLGIESRVQFLGQRSDVSDLLFAADIHCQPNTVGEPFGVAFIEAMQAAVPVVTTAQGGPLETIDESCGILTPPGDTQALADALEKLIDDPALRRRLGSAGPARAKSLCDPAVVLNQMYEKLGLLLGRLGRAETIIALAALGQHGVSL